MEKVKLAVIGDPISHSKSPEIHNRWLAENNIPGEYQAIKVSKEELRSFLESLDANGFTGINITVPHKEESYEIVNEIGEIRGVAKQIKAINTIAVEDGKLIGYNTDAKGFINSVYEKDPEFSFAEKRILIIGAGGAARAIIAALKEEGVETIAITNRTIANAQKLKDEFNLTGAIIEISEIADHQENLDVVINTSSMGLNNKNNLEIKWLNQNITCIDIVYTPLITQFLSDAKSNGNKIITGEGMLMHQANLAFYKWFER